MKVPHGKVPVAIAPRQQQVHALTDIINMSHCPKVTAARNSLGTHVGGRLGRIVGRLAGRRLQGWSHSAAPWPPCSPCSSLQSAADAALPRWGLAGGRRVGARAARGGASAGAACQRLHGVLGPLQLVWHRGVTSCRAGGGGGGVCSPEAALEAAPAGAGAALVLASATCVVAVAVPAGTSTAVPPGQH